MTTKTPGQIAYEAHRAKFHPAFAEDMREWSALADDVRKSWDDAASPMRKDAITADLVKALEECQFRLWGAGPSTSPLYAQVRDALARARGNT